MAVVFAGMAPSLACLPYGNIGSLTAECSGRGSVDESIGAGACVCTDGYAGSDCGRCDTAYQDNDRDGTCLPSCLAGLDCRSSETCDDTSGTAVCACLPGSQGADCRASGTNDGGDSTTGGDTGIDGDPGSGTGGDVDTDATVEDLPWSSGNCSDQAGAINFETAEFCVALDSDSQTVRRLRPKSAGTFDFVPEETLPDGTDRSRSGYFHLGDITLRLRQGGSGWQNYSTHSSRTPVTALATSEDVLAAADLSSVLSGSAVSVTRSWVNDGGRLGLRFEITNTSSSSVEVGALGIPMVFNNYLSGRSLDQAHETCSFTDPYIGMDAGYVQVTRLNGQGPAMIVYAEPGTALEAYNPILNAPTSTSKDPPAVFTDPTPRSNTFEGYHEWMVHSLAFAQNEYRGAEQWHTPSSLTLEPGESKTYGLKFVLSEEIRGIESVLARDKRPVAVGIPGYILPTDIDGKLYIKFPYDISDVEVAPSGAIGFSKLPNINGWRAFSVAGKTWGRSRLTITFADGTVQTIHYYVTKPAYQVLSDMGEFLTSKAWFEDQSDPFGRSPSVMTFDKEEGSVVTQWKQAWVCGLGDDGGATWLAGGMKLFGQPVAEQVGKYQQFIDKVLWGNLQYSSGNQKYGVKRTLFYYAPSELPGYYDSSIDWGYWGAWDKAHTLQTPRSYNYPHPTALYWAMYRLARNYDQLVDNHSWDWYLSQAFETAMAMTTVGAEYSRFGLMNGSVFVEVLKDLQREKMTSQASSLERAMRSRADAWSRQAYPFGSEMPWDSTGQEEVYQWTKYFGMDNKADVCVKAVMGYMPTVPHWGYNGCARRYWDFKYGGSKTDRLERMIHHYGSSLNAIPLLSEYRENPDDVYLLRVGYAGMMGTLSNVDKQGFPSMAFHSFPDIMDWDPRTGDVGLAVFGHTYNTATYLVNHRDFGWQAFGGNVSVSGDVVSCSVLDSFRKRVYIAPVGLWLTLDAGQFEKVEYDTVTGDVRVVLAPQDSYTSVARLRVEQPAELDGVRSYSASGFEIEREAYVIPLGSGQTAVDL